MKYSSLIFLVVLLSSTAGFSQGSGFIDDFTLPNVVTGQEFSLREYEEASTVVVIFTSLYCPYAQLYEDRIDQLIRDFQSDDLRFILINPNNPKSSSKDSMENMVRTAQEDPPAAPFLADHNQRVARMFGAEKTPEVFVLARQTEIL